ncbi:rhodopsin-like isoform X2 [Leptopilina boulardi]|uniref:rhodopsin-like isoform X2 n=1 Tax=Leptopilina boulardi TaxID=63433 RepID=UPI0021F5E46E|nr:rhodopsin-like isoform X2 [Leptopilina boulardi]
MSLSNNTNPKVLLPDEQSIKTEYIVAGVLLATIGFFGFFLNLLVIVVIIKDARNLWTPVNVVLLNMVVGDFLVSILGNPLALTSALNGGWYWHHHICIWYAWLMSTLGLASIGNLTVMAIERWMLITRPMKAFSIRQAILWSLFVWIYALSLSLPPVFGWGSYGPEAENISCSVSWETHNPETYIGSYIAYLFLFGLIIPVVVIGSSYGSIILTLRNVKRRIGSRRRQENKVTKMVALMIFAFMIAWTPYSIAALGAQYFDMKLSPEAAMVPAILAKSSICYNPIIYAGLNKQFVLSMKTMFGIQDSRRNMRGIDSTRGVESVTALSVVKHENKLIIFENKTNQNEQQQKDIQL